MQRLAFGSARLRRRLRRLSVDLLRGPVCSIADSACKSAGHRMILTAARSSTLSTRLSFITEGHHNLEKVDKKSYVAFDYRRFPEIVCEIISVHDNYCSSKTGSPLKAFNFGKPTNRVETRVTVASDSELREWCRRKRMDRAATPPHFAVSMCPVIGRFAMAAG
uniref:Uncharacterized protein n=2 Tax=Oryza TaxID=4527 RepID=A0A0E0PXC2_ORYRU